MANYVVSFLQNWDLGIAAQNFQALFASVAELTKNNYQVICDDTSCLSCANGICTTVAYDAAYHTSQVSSTTAATTDIRVETHEGGTDDRQKPDTLYRGTGRSLELEIFSCTKSGNFGLIMSDVAQRVYLETFSLSDAETLGQEQYQNH